MKTGHLTLKVFLLIVLNDVGDTIAQFFMKKGLAQTGITCVTFSNIADFLARSIGSGLLWLGLAVFALNFFVWIVILYKVDLSIAMPVGSTSYIFVPLVAVFFLGEHISILRWAGITLIVLGIHFVSKSKKDISGSAQIV
ncbi:MAG TPA: EamA family transporter [Candidatus Omnitrophota bacterium]|nr:EamA family transporter [Candidatus Omnitrophota bacterium]